MKRGILTRPVSLVLRGEAVVLPPGTGVKFLRREGFVGWVVEQVTEEAFPVGSQAARYLIRYEVPVPCCAVLHTRGREN